MGTINRNNNNVILVSDIACAAAIEYSTSYRGNGTYRDMWGHIWTTFPYSEVLEEYIEDYHRGDFQVMVPGFVEYYKTYIAIHNDNAARFDESPTERAEE